MGDGIEPLIPDFSGPNLAAVVPAILGRANGAPQWLPAPVAGARQVAVLVLDGLGWLQLQEWADTAPTLAAMTGSPIATVVPSTTATALTSLTTGAPPARHGVVGYRVRVRGDEVLNVLRWKTGSGDARDSVPPEEFQPLTPFGGLCPPVVTRAEFAGSGFTRAHLAEARLFGWRMPSTMVVTVAGLLEAGEPFVYAYYDGVDKVAHEYGLGPEYRAELAAADRIVEDLITVLPPSAALVVVSDHGQVDVGDRVEVLHDDVRALAAMLSGEGRFRWLHARPGMANRLADEARRWHGDAAWVVTRDEMLDQGWLGGDPAAPVVDRLGDVALIAHQPLAFADPADTGDMVLRSRHGSLTDAEMLVPLLAASG